MAKGLRRALCRVRAGYSLFEVLVVVAIMGIAATISGPSISRMITAQQAKQVVRGVVTEFGAIRAEAFMDSSPFDAEDISDRLTSTAPEGWRVTVDDSVTLTASGYCRPGQLHIDSPSGRRWALAISEGDCLIVSQAPRVTD